MVFCCNLFSQDYNTLLWEISGNDLKESSYLYGTMHLQDNRVFDFGDAVMEKLAATDALALEVVMEKDALMNPEVMGALMMPDGTLLSDLLNKSDYMKVKATLEHSPYFKELGPLSSFLIDRIRPIWLSMTLTEDLAKKDKPLPLDMFLQELGEKQDKKLISIETIYEQMKALDTVPLQQQADMLLDQVSNRDAPRKEFTKLIEMYQKEDLMGIDSLTNVSMDKYAELNNILLVKRNGEMTERIHRMIRQQSTFVAVGTAHLTGETGLIQAFQKLGYNVDPVFSANKHDAAIIEAYEAEKIEILKEREIQLALAKDSASLNLNMLVTWMTGSFNSEQQSKADSSYFNINLEMYPIWTDHTDAHWIYVEQSVAGSEDKPYRQRIYQVIDQDSVFISNIFKIPSHEKFVNQFGNKVIFEMLDPSDLIMLRGCGVTLKANDTFFTGSTGIKTCPSELRGAVYATSNVLVSEKQLISWDRGFNSDGEQVWGAVKGAYVFDKIEDKY